MEDARVLTISELLRRARPVTATASLSISIRPFSSSSSKTCKTPSSGSPISNPKILTPLEFPAILVGTLTLLSHSSSDCDPCSSNRTFRCPNNGNCLQFSDDSSTICCDVLHFDVRVVGKRIRVIAWNFLPLNCGGVCGGFLEIINWNFQDSGGGLHQCLNVVGSFSLVPSSISPCKDSSKARYYIHGVIVSVSPVTVVPTRTSQSDVGTTNIRGFLVQIMACDCKLCNLKESVSHSFTKCVFVYFSGSASSWHPVITKLIKNVVTFSGLKRKLVFIGKEESELMYVTTERTLLVPSSLPKIRQLCTNSFVKEKVVFGTYTGVIRGVYMHGMVVELDEEVWLLLSDQLLAPPHSLRVGALISVRNVHFVNPKFSWTNMRILGACFKTSIVMESFSPLETGCHVTSHSQSPLGKFIESLAFPARFWVLLVVSSLRKKFSGILSEKEILGSKHFSTKLT